ncbi:nitroreductase family protein [bacterium]|nr:nitroreductase family protein [bacterium]
MTEWNDQSKDDLVRVSEYPVEECFLKRWSPRAMTGQRIESEVLMQLFEAARWAPSSMNNQPWRFVYSLRDTDYFGEMFGLLAEGNQVWCKNAAALVIILSLNVFESNGRANRTHSFDCGAAWMSLALAGSLMGLVVHGMAGFDYKGAHRLLGLTESYSVEAMCAIGYRAAKDTLPLHLQKREVPSDRKKLVQTVFEGRIVRDGP